jgi:hypothetical protein
LREFSKKEPKDCRSVFRLITYLFGVSMLPDQSTIQLIVQVPVVVPMRLSRPLSALLLLTSFSLCSLLLTACGADSAQTATIDRVNTDSLARVDSTHRADSLFKAKAQAIIDSFPKINYTRFYVATRKDLDSIRKVFGKTKESNAAFRAITTLNRKEFGFIRVGDTLALPDSISSDLRAYSCFPYYYAGADTLPKLIIVSNKMQAYACYEYGRLVRFAACNTGTEGKPTFPGRYALNWKERLRISSLNDNWKLPFTWNFHLYAGNAFHQFVMPGRPVSHSCVRQFMTDAEWLFSWGEGGRRENGRFVPFSGTPVIITDIFDFSRKRGGPWLDIASNRDGLVPLPENPMGVEEALIPISQVPADARGSLGADRQRYLHAEDTLRARGIIRPEAHLLASIDYNKRRKAKAAAVVKKRAAQPAAPTSTEAKTDAE